MKYTIGDCLKKAVEILKGNQHINTFLESQLLIGFLLNKDRVYVLTHKDKEVSNEFFQKYFELINKRKQGYPLQYITGKQEFMGLDFFVGEGVLIPRPDTENIVEKIMEIFSENESIKILDIGAGTGAIGLSLAKFFPESNVTMIDIDEKALENILVNKERLKIDNAHIRKIDVFSDEILSFCNEFDLIVSNPPYIPSLEIPSLQKEVSVYEPALALDGGVDGLKYYRRIIKIFSCIAKPCGVLALEIGYNQKKDVWDIIEETKKFKKIETIKDLQGYDRGLVAYF